jgi:hypothetical protein
VTITGLNLGTATAVAFNGTSAAIISKTATKVLVDQPAGASNRFHHRYYSSRHGDQRHALKGHGVDQGAWIGQATRSTCGTQWDYARCVGQMPPLTSRNLRPELGKEMIKSLTRDRAWGACPAPGHTGAG